MTLGQAIIIGKRYRLNIRLHPEYRCPLCDRLIGEYATKFYQGTIVTVLRPAAPMLICTYGCKQTYATPEGLWNVDIDSSWVVPYTWLARIEDEDYGETPAT